MLRRLLSGLFVVLLTVGMAGVGAPAALADQTEVNDRVKDSMVLVGITFGGFVEVPASVSDDGEAGFSSRIEITYTCSGFVVDPSGFIATAGHCVDNDDEDLRVDFRRQFLSDQVDEGNVSPETADRLLDQANSEQWIVEGVDRDSPIERIVEVVQPADPDRVIGDVTTVQVVDFQKFDDGDNALLKVNGIDGLKPLSIAPGSPALGQEVTSVGFPGTVSDVADSSRVPQPSFKSGTVSSIQTLEGGIQGVEIDADVSQGMSGGPTINSQGGVLGINSFGFTDGNEDFITDVNSLRSFLQKNAVDFTEGTEDGGSSIPWIWMIVAAVGVVIVVVAVIIAIMLSRRSKGGGGGPQGPGGFGGPGGPTTPYPPQQPQQQPWTPTQQWQPGPPPPQQWQPGQPPLQQ